MAVYYFDEDIRSGLKEKRRLSSFIKGIAMHFLPECKKVNINYVFCSDESLLEKNISFLEHDTFTDVITFDLSVSPRILEAEIYISIDRIIENAEKFGVSYQNELHRVIFHGLLHLCGFKDKSTEDIAEMRRQEQNCLHQYFN